MKKGEKFLILEGIFSNFYFILTQGVVFTAIALYFNFNEVLLGMTAAFPMIFQLLQIITPSIIEKFKYRKKLLAFFNSFKLLWIIIIFAILFEKKSPIILITTFAFSQAFTSLAGNTWSSLVSDIIPPEKRGKYFGIRSVLISFSTLLIFYLFSYIIDTVPTPYNFIYVIGITLVGVLLALLSLIPVQDPPVKTLGTISEIKEVIKEKNFLKLSFANLYWNFILLLTAPFFSYHQLKNLKISMTYISYATIAMTLISMLFYFVWGKLSDKYGNKTVMIMGLSFVSISPIIWILMNEQHWPIAMTLDAVISGIGWAAINISLIILPMEVAKRISPMYFAVFGFFGGIGGLIGSIFGGYIATFFNQLDFYINNYHIFGLQIYFVIEGILRIIAIFIFSSIKTQKYVSPTIFMFNVLNIIARRPTQRIYENAKIESAFILKKLKIEKKRLKRWW
ncbi:MFS transporter [Thermosipho melanesiensis]|uniref:Major facilitator superfamily MFS_1 n=2 Tax=Thermosipho melanesiensis TaxID=46541 RepID=A6LLD4_THEM4|nr:MFS transporter [Thermosipho melanesiensis]ABR30735.1 major facilitator superfamily MFS_1 [Thermosipho melanesiensis BI429]APT73861.1 MFS transporter [Thermosipho melanesiensis]OOC35802.1 MFS transporter [Thermosipho melanesiensis]OOC38304.1 MFS transporter [Thermosipho melanesiensis]OOC38765.1 MFS transporter [Thermosipho melanesiensis]